VIRNSKLSDNQNQATDLAKRCQINGMTRDNNVANFPRQRYGTSLPAVLAKEKKTTKAIMEERNNQQVG
jgi:hypothetical protein